MKMNAKYREDSNACSLSFPPTFGYKVQLNPITTSHLYLILRENSVHNINQPIFLASRFQPSLLHVLLPIAYAKPYRL